MRKFTFIVVGLLLFAGAAGAFVYRVYYHPYASTTAEKGATRALQSEPKGQGLEALARERYYQPQLGGWQVFSMVMDVLNFVVGGVGIVLTVSGIRMRRAGLSQHM